jgi:CHAD domain-containing protein
MRHALEMDPGEERYIALHEARKAARQARYAAEAVSPALGKDARRFGRRMKRLQDALGEQHDRVVAGDAIVALADKAFEAGEPTFTYGLMRGSVDCEGKSYDALVLDTWKHVDKARRPGWMD